MTDKGTVKAIVGPVVLAAVQDVAAEKDDIPGTGRYLRLRFGLLMAPLLLLITGASTLFMIVVQQANSGHIAVVVVRTPLCRPVGHHAAQSSASILEGSSLLSLATVRLFTDILPVLAVSTIVIIAAVVARVPEELPRAMADVGQLEQVLFNLLHNAIRHTPPGGIVAVVAALEIGIVQIEVRDTGTGIAPTDLPRI